MRLSDFEAMVVRMAGEVPREFLDGVAEIVVSPRTVPHPERPGIFTLGECIPLPSGGSAGPEGVQSRIVLFHGSFAALGRVTPGFDWREEAFETLTHELRHHLEWRAHAPDLEELDWAVEQNYARQDGEAFDPAFYLAGSPVGDDTWRVEDDVFLDHIVRAVPGTVPVRWAGRDYVVTVPPGATLPAFLVLEGIDDPPSGELMLVLRRKPGMLALLRPVQRFHAAVRVVEPMGYLPGASPDGGAP
ncbi:MAG: metallopeptidase family protein [Gemmatimonadota bacterium]|nr:metallopeptidase family protein [Gemmatimonadota bacterium]